jgi:hypothetical protein
MQRAVSVPRASQRSRDRGNHLTHSQHRAILSHLSTSSADYCYPFCRKDGLPKHEFPGERKKARGRKYWLDQCQRLAEQEI